MPVTRCRPLASNLKGAIGCDYIDTYKRLVFVEFGGNISSIDMPISAPHYQVLGTGYKYLQDVVASADGIYAYVTERTGNLLRVDLKNADRAHAQVVNSDITAPHQTVLDEDQGFAYVVEFADPGRLIRVELTTGIQTTISGDLEWAIGLLITNDLRFAYVSEQPSHNSGQLCCIDMSTGQRRVLVSSLAAPFFLTWADNEQNTILTTERDPANRVVLIDPSKKPATVTYLAAGVPNRPSSVIPITPERLLLCCDEVVCELSLTQPR